MKPWQRALFFFVAWLIVLLPFLFWRGTWFGRPLRDAEINDYLRDNSKPRRIQHALVQIGERMTRARERGAPASEGVAQWYPVLARLASHPVEEVRNTDAWIMGQDPSRPEFHAALLRLLADSSFNVRSNAALSLVSFGDGAGHAQIVSMLQPAVVYAPNAGRVAAEAKPGEAIHEGTVLVKLQSAAGETREVRAPITGRVKSVAVAAGGQAAPGAELAAIEPGPEQAWEALRALYLMGTRDDLPLVRRYEQARADLADRVRQQALYTEKEIRRRNP